MIARLCLLLVFAATAASHAVEPAAPVPTPTPPPVEQSPGSPAIQTMEPAEAPRGSALTFKGSGLPERAEDIEILLDGDSVGTATYMPDSTTFLFQIPEKTELGRHRVQVRLKLGETTLPPVSPRQPLDAILTVFRESGKSTPKITGIHPVLGYPEKNLYGFEVLGEGFSSKRAHDNGLIFQGRGEVPVCWKGDDCWVASPSCGPKGRTAQVYGEVINERQLSFRCLPGRYRGLGAIQVRVGQEISAPTELTLSRVSKRIPGLLAFGVFALLAAFVFWLASRGASMHWIGERKYGFFRSLLIDKETDTYSLSRFQLYAWTATAILSYLYLAFSRSLVQWKLDFAEIPPGLPGILLISASTGFLAQGIQGAKGPKGAGEENPSPSDLITTGGVVAPERFQFLVWTILGILVFLSIVFLQEPGNIQDLPTVPMGFLELMGISSFGYLGGKMARKPGPVIDEIMSSTDATGNLVLNLRGRCLSRDASFRIDDKEVSAASIVGPDHKPTVAEKDEKVEDPNAGKVLVMVLQPPFAKPAAGGKSKLTIINPDGQKAVSAYT